MQQVTIIVWDNIGNTLLGVRPWEAWAAQTRDWLLAEDPAGAERALGFRELFAAYDVDLRWFVTDPSGRPLFDGLAEDFATAINTSTSVEQIAAAVADADYVVIHKERLPAEALRGASHLKLLQHLGQDHRGIPLEAARVKGIPVAATPLVNYLAVAEHVWGLILSHLKRLPALRVQMAGQSGGERWAKAPGIRLARDLTLGLAGFGEIARPVARIARAFDMPVIYWDIERFPDLEERYGVRFVAWDELFRQADVLSVQLALNARTAGIIGAHEIALMKPDAFFVNTARGKLVDQAALTAALRHGKIGGAALDVFAEEPLPDDDPLYDLHARLSGNVTLTPHIAWQGPWTWVRDSHGIWFNVLRSLRGEPVEYLV